MGSRLAFIFPGQGSQTVGMGRAFYEEWSEARYYFERADEVSGTGMSSLCFEGPGEELAKTEHAQPALFTVSCICAAYVMEQGVTPVVVAGHSLGEYAALVAAGVWDFETGLAIVCERARLMSQAARETDGMAAVLGLPVDGVEKVIASTPGVKIANVNCPGQVVISGVKASIEAATGLLRQAGAKRVVPLAVSGAFHTDVMSEANARLVPLLEEVPMRDARVPAVQNSTGRGAMKASELLESLKDQMTNRVLWQQSVGAMADMNVSMYVELGPGTVLKGLVQRCLPGADVVCVAEPKALHEVEERIASA